MAYRRTFGTVPRDTADFKTIYVESLAAFPAPVANVITLEDNTAYLFSNPVDFGVNQISIPTNGNVKLGTTNEVVNTITTDLPNGATPFISGTIGRLIIDGVDLVSNNGCICFELSGGAGVIPSIFYEKNRIQGFSSIGTFDKLSIASENVGYISNTGGLAINDAPVVQMAEQNFALQTGDHISMTGDCPNAFFNTILGTPATADAIFNIDSSLTSNGIQITNGALNVSATGTYFASTGIDQTDPKVTTVNVNGVDDSKWIGAIGYNGASNVVNVTATDTYQDIPGTFVTAAAERFRVSSDSLVYTGLQPITGVVLVSMSLRRQFGFISRQSRIGVFLNGAEVGNFGREIGGQTSSISFAAAAPLKNGDKIKSRIKNEDNQNNFIIADYSIGVDKA